MNALTFRTLGTLPAELQSQIRAHHFDDLDEIVQAAALALLEARAGDTMSKIFSRARSATRRFTQDLAHHSTGIDAVAESAVAGRQEQTPMCRRDITREVAQQYGVTPRRARQIVAEQIERTKINRDLFVDDENRDVEDDGEGGK